MSSTKGPTRSRSVTAAIADNPAMGSHWGTTRWSVRVTVEKPSRSYRRTRSRQSSTGSSQKCRPNRNGRATVGSYRRPFRRRCTRYPLPPRHPLDTVGRWTRWRRPCWAGAWSCRRERRSPNNGPTADASSSIRRCWPTRPRWWRTCTTPGSAGSRWWSSWRWRPRRSGSPNGATARSTTWGRTSRSSGNDCSSWSGPTLTTPGWPASRSGGTAGRRRAGGPGRVPPKAARPTSSWPTAPRCSSTVVQGIHRS